MKEADVVMVTVDGPDGFTLWHEQGRFLVKFVHIVCCVAVGKWSTTGGAACVFVPTVLTNVIVETFYTSPYFAVRTRETYGVVKVIHPTLEEMGLNISI